MTTAVGPLDAGQLAQVVGTGVQAPSVHNTVHAHLAVRGPGRASTVAWLPAPGDDDHVATVTVGAPAEATLSELDLLAAVRLRRTDRTAFTPHPVPPALVDALVAASRLEDVHLGIEDRHDRVLALEGFVSRADHEQRHDDALRQETSSWVPEGRRPSDGLPGAALPDHGHDQGSSLALRDDEPEDGAPPAAEQPPVAEHALLVLLTTITDGPGDWVRAGGALARVPLTATAAGLVVNPHTQVLEVPGQRWRLVAELGLVGVPQMPLRVGYPQGPGSRPSGRRPVADVLPV